MLRALSLVFVCLFIQLELVCQWNFIEIGDGTKPTIHVDAQNTVHAAALKEDLGDPPSAIRAVVDA